MIIYFIFGFIQTISYNLEDSAESTLHADHDSCYNELVNINEDLTNLGRILNELREACTLNYPPPSPTTFKKEKKSKKSTKKVQKAAKMVGNESSSSISTISDGSQSKQLDLDGFLVPTPMDDLRRSNPDLSILSMSGNNSVAKSEEKDHKISSSGKVRGSTFSVQSQNMSSKINEITDAQIRFISSATKIHKSLANVSESFLHHEDVKQNKSYTSLLSKVSQLSKENTDLNARLKRIHQDSAVFDPSVSASNVPRRMIESKRHLLGKLMSESQLSITDTSTTDMFYDAEEYLLSDEESSTDEEESEAGDDDVSSEADVSDNDDATDIQSTDVSTMRRVKLPCPSPDSDVSLWNILKKNIGKDLSKVAMPVTLNEPLNALQLLCEELEYSELLDEAAVCSDKYERMALVAAFAISGYCSTYHRAGQKPFNPILGESYECVREDKNFSFVAEQVSHHPPISACHCIGNTYEFWQDVRFKNKFWGKSMEIFPVGSVHVKLKDFGCTYEWKKVTSCVHNIVAGSRWIEHYGDMVITSEDVVCKILFSKSGYWNGKHGAISGVVLNNKDEVMHKLHGKWFEGIFCETSGRTRCIWRPGVMPHEFERHYGFSKFAIQLNELLEHERKVLPHTDTRFRPDQRLLEVGDVDGAEMEKQRVEQIQRDQKRLRDANNIEYLPKYFKKVSSGNTESWMFIGNYWQWRKDGFANHLAKQTALW
uniref:oxysterol-binding protein-related protein 6 isoform X2 n=1 Tax=Ciona intestinalis TaxID=7719 RepID=UPI000EF4A813|nr:oxysterol-binding protein-related protein 6 isoform X2 [Ciona intestinalis]|eukprot:XP_026691981.1 oxysterol-binding protein-related protein 6 isoform X2 [Ciona intestinalis]